MRVIRFSFLLLSVIAIPSFGHAQTTETKETEKQETKTAQATEPRQANEPVSEDAASKKHPLVGRQILITKAGAEIRTRKGIVWKAYFGEVFSVALVKKDWYWIQEKGGWLWSKAAIPLDEAVEKYTADIEKEKTAENYHSRGMAYWRLKDHSRAILDFDETIKLKPQYAGAYINRGNAYRDLKNNRQALADFSTAVQLDAKSFIAYNNRGLVHTDMKNFNAAMTDFNQALQLNKDYAEAFNNRGVVWRELGQMNNAFADYTRALTLYPLFVEALVNRGYVLKKMGRYDNALGDYSKAALLSPFNPNTLNNHAWLLATCPDKRFRDGKKALVDAQKACELTKKGDWNCLDTLAASYAEVGEFDKAVETATAAVEKAPTEQKTGITQRIAMYQSKQAFRENSTN